MYETKLNKKQKYAFDIMKKGYNTFLTGQGGTGKSYTIKTFKNYCKHNKISHAVTATTGVSALLINGTTLHSWSGILLGEEDKTTLLDRVQKNSKATDLGAVGATDGVGRGYSKWH